MKTIKVSTNSVDETVSLGENIGSKLRGGEVIVLKSDLGGGKTTLTRGLAKGFGSPDRVASPSFTISYVYGRSDDKQLHHYDFYRLQDAGVVGVELSESIGDTSMVTIIEWGDLVSGILPENTATISIISKDGQREITIEHPEEVSYLFEDLS